MSNETLTMEVDELIRNYKKFKIIDDFIELIESIRFKNEHIDINEIDILVKNIY